MTREEKIIACKRQFLFDSFYDTYRDGLDSLWRNPEFMREIREVSDNTAEPLLYGKDIDTSADCAERFRSFKNSFCDIFFESLKFADFPEYKNIYYSIKDGGHSGKSATISVFYAMIYLDLKNDIPQNSTAENTGFFHGLFANHKKPEKAVEKKVFPQTRFCILPDDKAMKKGFRNYLVDSGYKQFTPSGNPSTVYDYLNRIDDICSMERMSWRGVADAVDVLARQYDRGGEKEEYGNKSHRAVINALLRYREYVKTL